MRFYTKKHRYYCGIDSPAHNHRTLSAASFQKVPIQGLIPFSFYRRTYPLSRLMHCRNQRPQSHTGSRGRNAGYPAPPDRSQHALLTCITHESPGIRE
jgi:hypothetical protein